MRRVNRAVVVLRPKQPFIDWVLGDGIIPATPEQVREPFCAYLIPTIEVPQDEEKFLRRHYRAMFEKELDAWMTDPKLWPPKRDLRVFREWFEPQVVELVKDLCDEELVVEEE